jgi:ABC-2 type transport system permease protein
MSNIFRIWLKFASLNIQRFMEYRLDFLIGMTFIALSNIIHIVFLWVIFGFSIQINGWSFEQVMFLLGMEYLTVGIWHTFLTGISTWEVEKLVRNGDFDRVLLQPIGSFAYMLMSRINSNGFGDIISGSLVLFYASSMLSISWSPQSILTLVSFIFGGALIFMSFNIITSTVSMISIRSSSLGEILWNLERFIQYPLDIFNPVIVFILTFIIPFGFINYYPAQLFLGKGIWMQAAYLTPLVGLISFFVSYLVWKAGIKHYSSTGN